LVKGVVDTDRRLWRCEEILNATFKNIMIEKFRFLIVDWLQRDSGEKNCSFYLLIIVLVISWV
jgi:hypothetical protein